jgi:3-polyprenyl-4-hydroxybenzoate decarboxylase
MNLIVGIPGTSGTICGIRLLEAVHQIGIASHLVLTATAQQTTQLETSRSVQAVQALATHTYAIDETAAPIASGSFRAAGMVMASVPAFYHLPSTIDQIVDQPVGKVPDKFDIEHRLLKRWQGPPNV